MLVSLEMDQKRMRHLLSDVPMHMVQFSELAAYLAAGVVLGVLHFSSLWQIVRLFAGGGRLLIVICLTVGRFVLLGGALALASLEGAMPLLLVAVGSMAGRFVVTRSLTERAS
jgi:N-ATPase, AtpR subunit